MKVLKNKLNKAYNRYNISFIYDINVELNHRDIEKIWWCKPTSKKDVRVVVLSEGRVAVLRGKNDSISIEFHNTLIDFLHYYFNDLKMLLKLDLI